MWKSALLIGVTMAVLAACALSAGAAVYRVGPGEKHAKISQVVGMLNPGDVVELTGDIKDSFTLEKHGFHDKPITIRGVTRVENGRIVRPRITLVTTSSYGITCSGDWNVLEGLDLTRPRGASAPGTAVSFSANSLVIRNCYIHHIHGGVFALSAGDMTVEFCEFDSTDRSCFGILTPDWQRREGTAVIQHCWFHDNTGDIFIFSRYPRNVIRYNWFESSHHSAVEIVNERVDLARLDRRDWNPRPMHTDILGNVFDQGSSPGPRYELLLLGGSSVMSPGTEGDFHVAHNLFLMTKKGGVAINLSGNVDRLLLYNNVFLEYGVGDCLVYERGPTWDTPETRGFRERRGHGEPVIIGANNWVSAKMKGVLAELENTLRGVNPKFADILGRDFSPAAPSPLIGAGLFPLPQGRVIELAPEFEPVRGIPPGPKPRPRRKARPPSIGPFEAAARR